MELFLYTKCIFANDLKWLQIWARQTRIENIHWIFILEYEIIISQSFCGEKKMLPIFFYVSRDMLMGWRLCTLNVASLQYAHLHHHLKDYAYRNYLFLGYKFLTIYLSYVNHETYIFKDAFYMLNFWFNFTLDCNFM